jgi:hypothetical protein
MEVEVEAKVTYEGCVCPPDVNIWGDDICAVCKEERDDYEASEALIEYCTVCDGGHYGGEFGELCLANGRHWFEPSDPRDIYDGEDCF